MTEPITIDGAAIDAALDRLAGYSGSELEMRFLTEFTRILGVQPCACCERLARATRMTPEDDGERVCAECAE